jgi:hypothetical protein
VNITLRGGNKAAFLEQQLQGELSNTRIVGDVRIGGVKILRRHTGTTPQSHGSCFSL